METYETILVSLSERVATVTLNRPKVLNALNRVMIAELRQAFFALENDPAVHVAIITGAGERAFAAGADIGELNAIKTATQGAELARGGQALTTQLESMTKPVIGAINGYAFGGGCELALGCDFRLASENARFGQPEVNLGVMPGFGGSQRTVRLLGRGMAAYLCLSGEQLDAATALRIGLVQAVFPQADLMQETLRLAGIVAAKGPLAVAATKRAIAVGSDLPLAAGLEVEALAFGSLVDTHDWVEGTKAFLEKRTPAFTGT